MFLFFFGTFTLFSVSTVHFKEENLEKIAMHFWIVLLLLIVTSKQNTRGIFSFNNCTTITRTCANLKILKVCNVGGWTYEKTHLYSYPKMWTNTFRDKGGLTWLEWEMLRRNMFQFDSSSSGLTRFSFLLHDHPTYHNNSWGKLFGKQ